MGKKRVVVTGASGFIGSHVVDLLLARGGVTVIACVEHPSDDRWLRDKDVEMRVIEVVSGLGLEEALSDAHIVYHLAGRTGNAPSNEFDPVNHQGTMNVARTALRVAPRLERFVFVSSLAAVGPSTLECPHCEDAPRSPIGAYGTSKRDAEVDLEALPGLPLVIVRPPAILGPRDAIGLTLFKAARAGFIPIVRSASQSVSMVYVEDMARYIVDSVEADVGRGHVLHPPADNVDWHQLSRALGAAVGRTPRVVRVPFVVPFAMALLFEAWRMLTGVRTLLGVRKVREMLAPAWTMTTARRWPREGCIGLEAGLVRTAAWYRAMGWL